MSASGIRSYAKLKTPCCVTKPFEENPSFVGQPVTHRLEMFGICGPHQGGVLWMHLLVGLVSRGFHLTGDAHKLFAPLPHSHGIAKRSSITLCIMKRYHPAMESQRLSITSHAMGYNRCSICTNAIYFLKVPHLIRNHKNKSGITITHATFHIPHNLGHHR